MKTLWATLYPELEQIPEAAREDALHRAASADFDGIELAGIAFGLIATSGLTRFTCLESTLEWIFKALLCFFVAAPLLVVLIGPFLIRRTRRCLRLYSKQDRIHREAHP